MTDSEKREAARQFYNKWNKRGREDEDDRSFWFDILERVLGVQNATDHIDFQKKVIVDGNTKRIDAYIPETRVIIEQKSLGIPLDKKIHQSGDIFLTPYEQAKRYNDNLPFDEKARWIVTSNFSEIWVYDMNARVPEPAKITIEDLQSKYSLLDFLINQEKKKLTLEMEVSVKAGALVGKIYDALYRQYINPETEHAQKSLNMLCVRLVFCLYAEDAGIFGESRTMFHDYFENISPDAMRKALMEFFAVLDTKPEDRDPYDTSDLSKFPYVNGGLFADTNIEIPNFTQEIKDILLEHASNEFDWSVISPTIFGAVFESTLNPETRRSGGMHYTSIENIHKVIDPLFLDDFKAELEEIKKIGIEKTKNAKLRKFQKKLAQTYWLDPAAGSGNFLTETYISVRRLENEVISELKHGQMVFGEALNPIQVSISQFYGIEINDFAVTVAKAALWIAESQTMKETEDIVRMQLDFLPLKTNANIVEGNALRLDWEDVVSHDKLNFIMGNPPFSGARLMGKRQKEDVNLVFSGWKNVGNLDYVCCWYKKAAELMRKAYRSGNIIRTALVSTNSVSQGECVANLWKPLFGDGIHIDFAHRTFRWDSEANQKAHVHCVIVGFSIAPNNKQKIIFTDGKGQIAGNINGYILDAENIFIENRNKPICNIPKMDFGNMPNDARGMLSNFSENEKTELCKKYPDLSIYFHQLLGSEEYINKKIRYCLWFYKSDTSIINRIPEIKRRVETVRDARSSSNRAGTRKMALYPYLFGEIRQPDTNYIIVPRVSSKNRRYMPLGFISPEIIASDSTLLIPDATLYHFGVLTSNVHMAWMRAVCGRLKSDYRYSKDIVYNNFPWPGCLSESSEPTPEQKAKIEKTAQEILDARALYPDSSFADLYDQFTMPPELRHAHIENDRAVMNAYGFSVKDMSEEKCVAALMRMYCELTS